MAIDPLRPDDPAAIGGYELLGRLGQGGQGVVYLARWPGASGGPVALKTPHGGRADLSEITLVRQVARFCTARVLDAGTDGDRPYIVSEYVDGPSLKAAVEDGGPLSGVELERLAVGTMVALAATHAADVVHRDFTPGNVLLAPDGPRVVDFGVARALGPSGRGAPGPSGTPAFMAPEQAAGGEVGAAADVFAWAVTMTYAALGPAVLGEDGPDSAFGRLLRLERCLADLPRWLAEIVAPCLAEDPASRPAARDVLVRLLGYGERAAEPPEGGTTRRDRGPAPEGAHPRSPTIGRGDAEPSDRAERHPGPASGRTVISAWRRRRVLIVGTALALSGALAVAAVAAAAWPERKRPTAPATAPARPLIVGSANFPESVLLGEIYAQALEARGRKVVRRRAIGSREAYFPLVRSGEVDVVPEYNGALASYLGAVDLGARTPATTRSVNAALRRKLPAGLRMLGSSKAEDKDAVVVTRRTARRYGLTSLADLAGAADEFVLGGTPEAQTRRQGVIGLRAVYGAGFKGFQPFRQEDFGTMADLLDRGSLQAAQMFTTDPLLRSHGFTVLSDPEHLFGAQNVTPLVADRRVDAAARAALDAVSAELTTEDLRYMNARVAVEKDEVEDVAKAWLVQNGLLRGR
ncbi:glycine betaine ABC transporter substrate-binding protein [Actinomadura decatromicini]|uniref:Protein kinase n=1 Tax=Actinomadura decatromicini TaxID=2604572 RepID=A0A5D3F9X2_9ACTN|nr:glycine betaine ABC transporter substrate-binding protein [Actinomadura decatromicini]TYK44882.1 protein kinase [Actinomadura decatromicini]